MEMITAVPSGKKKPHNNKPPKNWRRLRSDSVPPEEVPAEEIPVEGESVLGGGTFLHSLLDVGVQFLTSSSSSPQLGWWGGGRRRGQLPFQQKLR